VIFLLRAISNLIRGLPLESYAFLVFLGDFLSFSSGFIRLVVAVIGRIIKTLLFLLLAITTILILKETSFILFELLMCRHCSLPMAEKVAAIIQVNIKVFHMSTAIAFNTAIDSIYIRVPIESDASAYRWLVATLMMSVRSYASKAISKFVWTCEAHVWWVNVQA